MDEQLLDCLSKTLLEADRKIVVEQMQRALALLPLALSTFTDAAVESVVTCLKECADRYWRIDANRSSELADIIIAIGEARHNVAIQALGWMAKGDALKLLGQMASAWEMLEHAGQLYLAVGDEVGWARTRIGRLYASLDLNCVEVALNDARQAHDIFVKYNAPVRLMRLQLATAQVYDLLGDYSQALTFYHSAVLIAQELGDAGQSDLSTIYNNMGYAAQGSGDLPQALTYYQTALDLFTKQMASNAAAIARMNIASIEFMQGYYRRALSKLHEVSTSLGKTMPLEAAIARRTMLECYLLLSRYDEARTLARQTVAEFQRLNAPYQAARTLLHLATAEAETGSFDAAQTALNQAETLFDTLGAENLTAIIHLRRGQIALRQDHSDVSRREARLAGEAFEQSDQQVNYSSAILLESRASFAEGDMESAKRGCFIALRIARSCNIPSLRYSANLLLGQIMETQGAVGRARRCYQAAAAVIERVQRNLTITMRPDFLEDKGEAWRSLIRLDLEAGRAAQAFETLERSKSQILLAYLISRESLRWADEPRTRPLIEQLQALREQHEWLFRQAHDPIDVEAQPKAVSREQALQALAEIEQQMRAITEQIYLYSQDLSDPAFMPTCHDIQGQLDADTLLIEFYTDGSRIWAFTVDQAEIAVHALPLTAQELGVSLTKLEANLRRALQVDPNNPAAHSLTKIARTISQQLHQGLIAPLIKQLQGRKRLMIVPYSTLHYLPFNILYDGHQYLIEQHELVILPSASLLMRHQPQREATTTAIAHSSSGLLPHAFEEAQIVNGLFGGSLYSEQTANRMALQAPPGQLLHIAAHGEHRIDQPDLSYIQLADGQLYTDDLFQFDLSYELVVLSCCETGRASAVPGDELIGLGRGFIYNGTGALVASLWPINDVRTLTLMKNFYQALYDGHSKSSALRDVQCHLLQAEESLHPAYWGAFQLIGDAAPLSSRSHLR